MEIYVIKPYILICFSLERTISSNQIRCFNDEGQKRKLVCWSFLVVLGFDSKPSQVLYQLSHSASLKESYFNSSYDFTLFPY
jgi:hypothetical protein